MDLEHLKQRRDRLKRVIEMMQNGDYESWKLDGSTHLDLTPTRLDEARQSLAAIERQIKRMELR